MALSPDELSGSATASLYCAEHVAAWDDAEDEWLSSYSSGPVFPSSPHAEERAVALLIATEPDHMPRADYLTRFLSRGLDATVRHDAVSWILKVNELYGFRPVTAYLSVNYLDRFLSSNTLPGQGTDGKGGWPMQLLSVACVSVAAKMEETHVPLPLDLQVLDPGYVFEPRTVRRMELLLCAALRWRMRAITPFDFLDLISALLPPNAAAHRRALVSRAASLVLSTHRVVDFLGYRPSVVAAAAVLSAAAEVAEFPCVEDGDLLACFQDLVSKEMVRGCRQLMEEYLIDACPGRRSNSRPELPAPQSPVGVLDAAACGSCDTQKSDAEQCRAEPPPSKRRRLGDSFCTASIDAGDDAEILQRD